MGSQPKDLDPTAEQSRPEPERPRPAHAVSGFLQASKARILDAWERRVTNEAHEVELNGVVLRNDIPSLLDELALWLAGDGHPETSLLAERALAHVMQRLDVGVALAQVFREYRLLRETIIEALLGAEATEQDRAGTSDDPEQLARVRELARLNAGLDVVLAQSVEQFVDERDRRAAAERARAAQQIEESETRYRSLFESIDEGFCVMDAVVPLGEPEHPADFRFLHANPAFERHTGLFGAAGRRIRELLPDDELPWLEPLLTVARTGQPARFETAALVDGRVHDVHAFRMGRPERWQVALVLSDITERKRAEEALRDANDHLVEADQRKNDFLAVLSHELRNPLAPIRNSVYILERAAPGGEQATRARQVIDRQTQHMARLIDDLLDVTRVTRGKVVLQRERVDLGAIARAAADDHRETFVRRGVDLHVDVPTEPLWVDGDRTRLAQVLGNLLTNTAKFTPRGGQAVLAALAAGDSAVVRVRDNGAGMSEETLRHLFEPFVQASQTLDRSRGGLGLGLALVKGIVEMHGGHVTARSDGEGRGAEFEVSLPLAPG